MSNLTKFGQCSPLGGTEWTFLLNQKILLCTTENIEKKFKKPGISIFRKLFELKIRSLEETH